jgi:hypothetical protein
MVGKRISSPAVHKSVGNVDTDIQKLEDELRFELEYSKATDDVEAMLADKTLVRPRGGCHACEGDAGQCATCQKIGAILTRYGFRTLYAPLVLVWFRLAAQTRELAETYKSTSKSKLNEARPARKIFAKFLATAPSHPAFLRALETRGIAVDQLMEALREQISTFDNVNSWLELMVRGLHLAGRGNKRKSSSHELRAILSCVMGMWYRAQGELPEVQRIGSKDSDEDGGRSPQPFVLMMRGLLEAVGRADLIPGLQNAAKDVRAELLAELKRLGHEKFFAWSLHRSRF